MNRSSLKWIPLAVGFVTVLAFSLILAKKLVGGPTPTVPSEQTTSTQPKVTWFEKRIEAVISPGEAAARDVVFSSSLGFSEAKVEPVPEIAAFVRATPASIPTVFAGLPQSVQLSFAVPSDAERRTYEGTVHVRRGSETLPQTLKVVIHVTGVGTALFLPPDPGEQGKATLEGIDADNDGVRDDVQRYIALNYPDSEKARAALTQYAKAQQQFLLSATDDQSVLAARNKRSDAIDCLMYVRPGDSRVLHQTLRAEILNTLSRSKAFNSADAKLSGHTFSITPQALLKQACTFDPDSMEN